MLDKEGPDIKQQVDTMLADLQTQRDTVITSESRTPEEYSRAITECATILDRILDGLALKTGWAFSVMMGGPDPSSDGDITVASFHVGENALGHTFGRAHPDWEGTYMKPYTEFIRHIYPPHIRQARSLGNTQNNSGGGGLGEKELEGSLFRFDSPGESLSPELTKSSVTAASSTVVTDAPSVSSYILAPPAPASSTLAPPVLDSSTTSLILAPVPAPQAFVPSYILAPPAQAPSTLAPVPAPQALVSSVISPILAPALASDAVFVPSVTSPSLAPPLPIRDSGETYSSDAPLHETSSDMSSLTNTFLGVAGYIPNLYGSNVLGGADHKDSWPAMPDFDPGLWNGDSLLGELHGVPNFGTMSLLPPLESTFEWGSFLPNIDSNPMHLNAITAPPAIPAPSATPAPPTVPVPPAAPAPPTIPAPPAIAVPPTITPPDIPVPPDITAPPTIAPPSIPSPPTIPTPSDPVHNVSRHSGRTILPSTRAKQMNDIGHSGKSTASNDGSDANKENCPPGTVLSPPSWLLAADSYLTKQDFGTEWSDCVKAWRAFELHQGYAQKKPLPCINLRPEEWASWIAKGRSGARAYDQMPAISSPLEFGTTVMKWWHAMQPPFRQSTDSMPVQVYSNQEDPASNDWEPLCRGGPNGMLSYLTILSWWGHSRKEGSQWEEDSESRWIACVVDLRRVLERIISGRKRGGLGVPSRKKSRV